MEGGGWVGDGMGWWVWGICQVELAQKKAESATLAPDAEHPMFAHYKVRKEFGFKV